MLLPNQSRSSLTCEDTNYVAVGSPLQKIKAAEAASPSGKFRFLINTFRRGAGA